MPLQFPGQNVPNAQDRIWYRFIESVWRRTGGTNGLATGHIWQGNSNDEPEAYAVSGDATLALGVLTLSTSTLSPVGRTLVGQTTQALMRSAGLGLGTAAVKDVNNMGDLTVDHVTFGDGKNIVANTSTGSKIGTATGQKLGFWNATPVIQQASANQAAVTLGNTDNEIGGLTISIGYSQAEVQALRDKTEELADDVRNLSVLVHALRTALVTTGFVKGSA